jgi:hypothetical protein
MINYSQKSRSPKAQLQFGVFFILFKGSSKGFMQYLKSAISPGNWFIGMEIGLYQSLLTKKPS